MLCQKIQILTLYSMSDLTQSSVTGKNKKQISEYIQPQHTDHWLYLIFFCLKVCGAVTQSHVCEGNKVYTQCVVCVAFQYLGTKHSLQGLEQLVGVVCEHPSILLKHTEQGASLAEQRGGRKNK